MMSATDLACERLGVKRAADPLDGGVHVTRRSKSAVWDEMIEELREARVRKILSVEKTHCKMMDGTPAEYWIIRAVYHK